MKYKILFFDIVHIVLIIAGYHYYKIKAFFALSNEKEDIMSKQNTACGKKPALKIVCIVFGCIIGLLALVLLCGRCYFRIPVNEYYKNSEKTFVIPGLSDGMIVQGLAYDESAGEFLVTGYRTDGTASQVSIVDKTTKKEVKRISLANNDGSVFTGHVGGITLHGNYIYVADSSGLMVYSYDEFKNASDGDTVKSIGTFGTKTADDRLRVAFTHVENDRIYVGEFYRNPNYPTPDSHKYTTNSGDKNTSLILEYRLDDSAEFGISPKIEKAYSAPDLVQGMCFDEQGRMYISTSYASAFSHIYIYNPTSAEDEITVLGQVVPLYVLDSSTICGDIKAPPMSEEIVITNGKLYTMCESATNKYIFGKLTSAKYCYATDVSKYIK